MKDDLIFIEHILESINAIKEFSKEITLNELTSNRLKRDAIVRSIEIIGEAIKNISKETKDRYRNVQWECIMKTGDKMIHYYFEIDYNVVWEIIKKDLPALKKQINEIKKDLE